MTETDEIIELKEGMPDLNEAGIKGIMAAVNIPGISIASFDASGKTATISRMALGVDHKSNTDLTSESIVRAASLSKPVFAYLVLKLIKDKALTRPNGLEKFDPEILKKFAPDDVAKAQKLTVRHILSHQTGLPNFYNEGEGLLNFQFEPGTEYRYSGTAFALLQEVIETATGKNLETLAKEHVFDPLGMTNSSFLPLEHIVQDEKEEQLSSEEAHAENSLSTTASDYARFVIACIKDMPEMFKSHAMKHDRWALEQGLSAQDLKKVSWGLGWGLQKTMGGRVTSAFHCGDMNEWRACVAVDLERKKGIVYFANSKNGLMLADTVTRPHVKLHDALNYMFVKYGFARKLEDDFEKKEVIRISKIILKYELGIDNLLEKNDITIYADEEKCTLSIKCTPKGLLFYNVICDEFDHFIKINQIKDQNYTISSKVGEQSHYLKIKIHSSTLYHQFLEKLKTEKLLPTSVGVLAKQSDAEPLIKRPINLENLRNPGNTPGGMFTGAKWKPKNAETAPTFSHSHSK